MKKRLYIISMAIATIFASCQKENDEVVTPANDRAVTFSTELITTPTRMSGSGWDKDDAIGITMLSAADNTTISNNIKYNAVASGASTSFEADTDIIFYPADDSEVQFTAYYPYNELWSYDNQNMIFDISGQDGTPEAQTLADLLISPINTTQSSDNYEFIFNHSLSLIQVVVSNYDYISLYDNLDNITATLSTKNTQYNLFNGVAEPSENTKKLEMVKTQDGEKATFTIILTPGVIDEKIIFTDGTENYYATLSIDEAKEGYQYNFTATIGDQGFSLIELSNANVTEWESQTDSDLSKDIEIVNEEYLIYTATGMKIFADLVNSEGNSSINGKLMNDIDLNGDENNQWTPIGTSSEIPYTGTFDGDSLKISGLYINNKSNYQGLFGYIDDATISNIEVSGSVTGQTNVGGIVGYALSGKITNCHNSCIVSGTSNSVGGIVGFSYASVSDCYNKAEVSGKGSSVGGVTGKACASITNCYNEAKVSGEGSSVGGVVGYASASIANCYNEGSSVSGGRSSVGGVVGYTITSVSDCYNKADVSGDGEYVGGVVGYAYDSSASIANCYNEGSSVHGGDYHVGGVVGKADASITNCYNEGSSVSGVGVYVGGVVGEADASVSDCHNKADVSGDDDYVGGVVGRAYASIANCYNEGSSVSGVDVYVGGIVGYTNASISDCYNKADVSGDGEYVGGVVGYAMSTSTSTSTSILITNCHNEGSSVSGGNRYVGGVVGFTNASVSDCYNKANVSGDGESVGGVVGYAYDSSTSTSIANCYNEGSSVSGGSSYVGGVVGYTNAFVSDCYNKANVSGDGKSVGGVVGYAYDSSTSTSIANCHNEGISVSGGSSYVGGVVGQTSVSISNCYNKAYVSGDGESVGGVVGYVNTSSASIANCYNEGSSVSGISSYVGGVVGYAIASVSNCYNTADVSGKKNYIGGVAGRSIESTICYNSGTVTAESTSIHVGGVIGYVSTSATFCYFNSDNYSGDGIGDINSNTATEANAIGYTTTEMQNEDFMGLLNNYAYAYNETSPTTPAYRWEMESGGYPSIEIGTTPTIDDLSECTTFGSGTEEDPYQILTHQQLGDLASDVNGGTTYDDKFFKLTKDIDLGGSANEFTAIGNSTYSFQGTFDGDCHTVSNLYIYTTNSGSSYHGFFGHTENATIKNLGVTGEVTGGIFYMAGIVGYCNHSTISNCYNAVNVSHDGKSTSTPNYFGGIVGNANNSTTIENCYNTGAIKGSQSQNNYQGGIAGELTSSSTITNCYSIGNVSGVYNGALVGTASSDTSMKNCYYDSTICSSLSAISNSTSLPTMTNVSGKTTTEMKNGTFAATLSGQFKEDSDTINSGYPILIWQ